MFEQNLHKATQTMKPHFLSIASLYRQHKQNKMETKTMNGSSSSNIFLTGAIFLANLDFAGLADYAIKAAVGGAIWLGYKLTADYIDKKRNGK